MGSYIFRSVSTRSIMAITAIAVVLALLPNSAYSREQLARTDDGLSAGISGDAKPPSAAVRIFSRDKIFAALSTRATAAKNLTMVAAHRGYWEKYPENSWGAIYAAGVTHGYEMVEADVKPAKNGYPVVFHDLNLNRVSTGTGLLSSIDYEQFLDLHLRDRFGKVMPHSLLTKPMTVKMLLANYGRELIEMQEAADYNPLDRPGFVLALDVKGTDPSEAWPMVQAIFEMIKDLNGSLYDETGYENFLTNSILIKIAAGSLPADPNDVSRMIVGAPLGLLNLCIVVNTKDDKDAAERIISYHGMSFVSAFEVVVKHRGDPDMEYVVGSKMGTINTTVGNFLVYYDFPTGVGNSKAHCCSTLSTDPASDKYIDYRGRWGWFAGLYYESFGSYFSFFTIDRPDLLVSYLKSIGMRDLDLITWDPIASNAPPRVHERPKPE